MSMHLSFSGYKPPSLQPCLRSLTAALVLTAASAAHAATSYSNLVVFGDSLSDTGNITNVTSFIPLAPYASGRFSNGPVYTDVLANGLGLSSLNSLDGGSNYAYGGAKIVPGAGGPPSLQEQASEYLLTVGGAADDEALYVVFGGGNDLLNSSTMAEAELAANALVTIVDDLITAGAEHILVPNLPDLGMTPDRLGDAGITARSIHYNNTLSAGIATLTGATIFELDVFTILSDIAANPAAFGITNTTEVCFEGALGVGGAGAVCSNPDEYLFWDGIHPTAAAHQLMGDIALETVSPVPVPGAIWFFSSAILALGFKARRSA